ncbi:MAG: hypothetical protein RL375_671 [Pseudomonadota bacterium]
MARSPDTSNPSASPRPDWRARLGLWLRCREATAVMLAALDQPIGLRQRILLRMHLSVCQACTRFSGQVRLMDSAMGQWRHYADTGELAGQPAAEAAKHTPLS